MLPFHSEFRPWAFFVNMMVMVCVRMCGRVGECASRYFPPSSYQLTPLHVAFSLRISSMGIFLSSDIPAGENSQILNKSESFRENPQVQNTTSCQFFDTINLNKDLQYKSKGTWYKFKFASQRSLQLSFFLHGEL